MKTLFQAFHKETPSMKMSDDVAREREQRAQKLMTLRKQMIDVSGEIACLMRMQARMSECVDTLKKSGCTMPVLNSTLETIGLARAQAEARYKHLDETFRQVTVGESYEWITVRGVRRGLPR